MGGRISDIYIETFVNATEMESRVRQAVENVLGEVPDLYGQMIEGTFGNPLIVLRARIHRKKDVERALSNIVKADYFARSLEKVRDRLDENGMYHLRLDKASSFNGAPELWSGGESIELRMKVVTYPFSYDRALATIQGLGSANGQR